MSDFNIDDVLSKFGEKSKPAEASKFDVNEILSKFGGNKPDVEKQKVIIRTPKPPISGLSKESSDELNQTREERFSGENPRNKLPTTNIQEKAYEADKAGKEMFSSGVEDFGSGHPYKGAAKIVGGAAGRLFSPLSGIIEGGVSDPITDITGNKDIGYKAGFIVGSLIPVGRTGKAINAARPTNKALSTLIENIGSENLPAVVSAMKSNPRLAPADLSPRVLQDTQHLFANEGSQIDYLAKTSAGRMAGAKDAVETAYDAATGLPVNAVTKLKALEDAAKKVGSEQINPAIAGAKPVDLTDAIKHIDETLKPGVMSKISNETMLADPDIKKRLAVVKQYLTDGKSVRTDANELHQIQSALRRAASDMISSSDGGARQAGHALMQVRNKVVDAIDTASGGKYKSALAHYKDEKHINDAFNYGYESVFTNSKKLEARPEFTEKWFKGLTDAEKEAAREGARLQLDTQMNNFRFAARKGQEIPEAQFNKDKLELLFGKEKTDTLVKALKDERAIANTHNKIIEGTQTAMRTASKSQFAMPTKADVGKNLIAGSILETGNIMAHGYPGVGSALLTGAHIANSATHSIKTKLAREHNAQYAKLALPVEGPSRDALIQSLEAAIPGPKQSIMTRGANTLSRLVAP